MASAMPRKIDFKGSDSILFESAMDTPPTGPYKVTIEVDPTLDKYTLYRPDFGERPLPVLAWAEGGCLKDGVFFGEFLQEVASHGFLVIADGTPNGTDAAGDLATDPGPQTMAIDWVTAENERPCSRYYHKLDTKKIAVAGQSCGGLMSIAAGGDPRVSTVIMLNSGLFERDPKIYEKLHAPMAIFDGGPDDVAYENGKADFAAIDHVPIVFANDKRGHGGTYWQDNGGTSAQVTVSWLSWQLYGDTGATAKGMFVGADCGLCKDSNWTLESKLLQ